MDKPRNTILVPAKSVLQHDDSSFVFVEVADGNFMRRNVVTGDSVDDKIIITSGLENNETIITEGAFYLLDAK